MLALTWLDCEHLNPLELLVRVEPKFVRVFISDLWLGRISDKMFINFSGY